MYDADYYSDADLEMLQAYGDAAAIDQAAGLGGVPFDANNPQHRAYVAGAVEAAWFNCTSVVVAVCETLADEGINADIDQDGLADIIFATSDRLNASE